MTMNKKKYALFSQRFTAQYITVVYANVNGITLKQKPNISEIKSMLEGVVSEYLCFAIKSTSFDYLT